MVKDKEQCRKLLEEVLENFDGNIDALKDSRTMGTNFSDMKKRYPDLIDEEFISTYEKRVYSSAASSVDDIVFLVYYKGDDLESLVRFFDLTDSEWIHNPKSMKKYILSDNEEVIVKALGKEMLKKIEDIIADNNFDNSKEFLECVYGSREDVPGPITESPTNPTITEKKSKIASIKKESKKLVEKEPPATLEVIKAPTEKIEIEHYTRFEKARIIGARALQISCGAPTMIDYPKGMLDPIDIALKEFDADVLPISVIKK